MDVRFKPIFFLFSALILVMVNLYSIELTAAERLGRILLFLVFYKPIYDFCFNNDMAISTLRMEVSAPKWQRLSLFIFAIIGIIVATMLFLVR